ncbi:MAG: hypothetical protein K5924_12595 [Chloroflexi bacterium]|nr:hypothetical protein [Chloroflexota bacterium]
MSVRTERAYFDALAIVSRPRFYLTMTEALASLPEYLRASYLDIAEAYSHVPHGPNIRAVLIDQATWAMDAEVPVYEAGYWIQRIANTHVRITVPSGDGVVSGYRPIMMIEHVQLDDLGEPNLVAVSIPSYGDVTP